MISKVLLVGLGGALGSMARYVCHKWISQAYANSFPIGTFAVNIIGCLLIGIIWALTIKTNAITNDWKLFLMTGLCGGFTTFSAFTLEGVSLLKEEKLSVFFAYTAGSVGLGLLSTFIGMKLIK